MPTAMYADRPHFSFSDTLPAAMAAQLPDSELNSELHSQLDSEMAGMPADRAARFAARRAFVEMKQIFMRAVAAMADRKGEWLRHQVRLANEPLDLWLLRGPVLASLRQHDNAETRSLRAELYRGLDNLFPDTFAAGGPPSVPPLPEAWEIWAAGNEAQGATARR